MANFLDHQFTATSDWRVAACLQCGADSWTVIADLVDAGNTVLPALRSLFGETRTPAKHHVERWTRQLEAAIDAASCPGGNDGESE